MKQLKTIIKIYTKWKPNTRLEAGMSTSGESWPLTLAFWSNPPWSVEEHADGFYLHQHFFDNTLNLPTGPWKLEFVEYK